MALTPKMKLGAAISRVVGFNPHASDAAQRGLAPYFGAILRGLIRREMTTADKAYFEMRGLTPTMGVSEDGVLFWSPEFVDSFKDDNLQELAYILLHEAMHVALKHSARTRMLGIVLEPTGEFVAKSTIANFAQDACVNEEIEKVIKAANGQTPKDFVLPEHLEQPRGLVFEERYRRLQQKVQKKGKAQPKPGTGWCGGCAGHPQPNEPASGSEKQKDGGGRSEAEMDRMRRQSAEMVREMSSKQRGLVPDSLVRWADEMLAPPKIPWREKLSRIVRGAVAYQRGHTDLTWLRPSRRQGGIGFGVGKPIVPALHAPVPNVAVVIDTSGSVGPKELAEALSEVSGVLAATGANVTLVVCDAAVHGIKPIKTVAEAMKMLKGGGGTAMAPAFEAIEKLKPRPSICITMTDGYIDHPPEPSFKTIWCIIGQNADFSMSYGEIVHVSDEDEKQAS